MRHLLILSLLVVALPAAAEAIVCRVVDISDGDTLTCLTADKKQERIRLRGIDAPERKQPFGARSTQSLPISPSVKPQQCIGTIATDGAASSARYGSSLLTVSAAAKRSMPAGRKSPPVWLGGSSATRSSSHWRSGTHTSLRRPRPALDLLGYGVNLMLSPHGIGGR